MALPTFDLDLSAVAADCSFARIKEVTVYGTPAIDRNTRGNYIIIRKRDVDNVVVSDLTPIQIIDFLTIAEWQFNTAIDGYYEFILLSVPIWLTAVAYKKELVALDNTEDIIYFDSFTAFYRCITDNTSSAPSAAGGDSNWELMTPAKFLLAIDNTGAADADPFNTHRHDDGISCRHEDVFAKELHKAVLGVQFKNKLGFKEIEVYQKLGVLLDGFNALNFAGRPRDMEEISRFVEDTYITK